MHKVFSFIPRQPDGSILPVHAAVADDLEQYLNSRHFGTQQEAALNLSNSPTYLGMSLGSRALVELACTAEGVSDGTREWLFGTAIEVAQEAADCTGITDGYDLMPYFRSRALLEDAPLQRQYFLEGGYPETSEIRSATESRSQTIIEIEQSLREVTRSVGLDLVGLGAEYCIKHLIERGDPEGNWLVLSSHLKQDMVGHFGDAVRTPPWDISVHGKYSWPGDDTDIRVQVKHGSPKKVSKSPPEQPKISHLGQPGNVITVTLASVAAEIEDDLVHTATFPKIAELLSGGGECDNPDELLNMFSRDVRQRLYLS
ncbi:MAG: hypothetical protein KIH63_005585 [Candidatus Saccharibacteria bacterium]|nr:hypothetical protein [Candidatus Saccharibacteria bacterium]